MQNNNAQKIIDGIISRAINAEIVSDVLLDAEQLDALRSLNEFSIQQILGNVEVMRDPRKIFYMSNLEMKTALVAICLAQAIVNPSRKHFEDIKFMEENITVSTRENNVKFISFGKIKPANVLDAIYWDIVDDWKIYRNHEGHGIHSLIDEKTNLTGLAGYKKGGNPAYEFARFHRKYTEKEHRKEEKARESAQEAFRNAMVQSLAVEMTKQQLLEGKNPMEMVELLFAPTKRGNKKKVAQISSSSKKVDKQIEQNITLLLEDNSEK